MCYIFRGISVALKFFVWNTSNFFNVPNIVVEMLHFRMVVQREWLVCRCHEEVTTFLCIDKAFQGITSGSFACAGVAYNDPDMIWNMRVDA